jgi:RNA methyltransferase, TrmH family
MSRLESLSSPQNPLIKAVRKAVQKGSLTEDGCAVAESFHLLEEAQNSKMTIKAILCSHSGVDRLNTDRVACDRVFILPDALFDEIKSTESSQGLIALVQMRTWTPEELFAFQGLLVVLDGVQDPGNCGTIIRAAEAFGASGIIGLKGTVNCFNPKALRASAGSAFRMPLVQHCTWAGLVEPGAIPAFCADPKAEFSISDVDLGAACLLVIGSEAHGISESVAQDAVPIRIPTTTVESLNAGISAAVILYEAARQRKHLER